MYRTALVYLSEWKAKISRKPLVIRGARQVGKSFLVRMFAQKPFENLIEINVERDRDAASLFASHDPASILPLLAARYGQPIKPGGTLLFLDEIQAAPELLAGLRYFHEHLPALHVIAAGSLLDFALADHRYAMPVGRIEYLHLGPMSFEEFLLARDRAALRDFLAGYTIGGELPEAIHAEGMRLVREFLVAGGMPASVVALGGPGGSRESEAERQSILSTFREDFNKYAGRADVRRIEKVFAKIPLLAGRKFMYSGVDREDRSRDLGRALELLCMARVAHRVRHTAANGLPMGAEADDRAFKVLFMDVGLMVRSSGLGVLDFEPAADPMLVNAGAVAEQFIGQHLLHAGEPYDEPDLHCWMRPKSQSSAEVDYLIAVGGTIVPVEVKAGRTGTLKSLHVFLREKRHDFGLRFNADRPSLLDAETSLADGGNRPFRLLSLPLYMVGQTLRLCRENM
ncbi:MAG: ATP-binding protein [Planctomycetota bacterium]